MQNSVCLNKVWSLKNLFSVYALAVKIDRFMTTLQRCSNNIMADNACVYVCVCMYEPMRTVMDGRQPTTHQHAHLNVSRPLNDKQNVIQLNNSI